MIRGAAQKTLILQASMDVHNFFSHLCTYTYICIFFFNETEKYENSERKKYLEKYFQQYFQQQQKIYLYN